MGGRFSIISGRFSVGTIKRRILALINTLLLGFSRSTFDDRRRGPQILPWNLTHQIHMRRRFLLFTWDTITPLPK